MPTATFVRRAQKLSIPIVIAMNHPMLINDPPICPTSTNHKPSPRNTVMQLTSLRCQIHKTTTLFHFPPPQPPPKTPKYLLLKQRACKRVPLHACGTPQDKDNQG